MLLAGAGMFLCATAAASGGTGKFPLDWPVRGERLIYHSCGCADACWVAEVQSRRTGAVLARLRCDCERLFFAPSGRAPEREIADDCLIFSQSGKFDAIPAKLMELRRRKH